MSVKVFGVPLDPLDAPERVELKQAYLTAMATGRLPSPDYRDPYEALTGIFGDLFSQTGCIMLGNMAVEGFLLPKPDAADAPQVTSTDLNAFIVTGGCREYAGEVRDFVRRHVLPEPFLMLGVDHSTTGGALEALSAEHEELVLIVLDAHFDGIGPREMAELTEYCMEVSPELAEEMGATAAACPPDMSALGRSYTCGDFLAYAFDNGWAAPERTFVLGVADYPRPLLRSSTDPRARGYVDAYDRFVNLGLTIVTREELQRDPAGVIKQIGHAVGRRPVYLSVDIDVACDPRGVYGARFTNLPGLVEPALSVLVERLQQLFDESGASVVGADLMELDVHLAGKKAPDLPRDRTYDVAGAFLVSMLRMLA